VPISLDKNQSNHSYFTAQEYLERRFDREKGKLAFRAKTVEEWRSWHRRLENKLKALTGYDTMRTCPLLPRVTERVEKGTYIRERVEIQTEPGIIMPIYVLIPKERRSEKMPVVIAPHGHDSGGKITVAGCVEIQGVAERVKNYNYDYGVQFVREGFVVFCPDARGFGERREWTGQGEDKLFSSTCLQLNQMAYPLGQTVAGMWAWDISRLIDYVQSRKDCNPKKIGCAGLSGGGLQTLWAAALDRRISCAVISGYFYGYKESLLKLSNNCSCNYIPHLWEYVDMGDIAALIAPRPLLIETGTRDPLNGESGLKNVKSQYRIVKKAYALLNAKDRLAHDIFEGEHMWHGAKAIPWMKRWLGK
jgi:dienelactone hydrolase